MRVHSFKSSRRSLTQGAALLLISGVVSGCSSDAMRFDSLDSLMTSSTSNQQQIIPPAKQPFPGDNVQAAAVDGSHSGSINRAAIEPASGGVSRSTLAPPPGSTATDAPLGARTAQLPAPAAPQLDTTTTGTVQTAAAPVQQTVASGEHVVRTTETFGGAQVTVKDGESIYSLSRRYGVPPKDIMAANGLTSADGLKIGQKVVIPGVASAKAVSKTTETKPVRTVTTEQPAKLPEPAKPSNNNVAVLPTSPKPKESGSNPASTEPATVADTAKKPSSGTYTVATGDSLSKVAKKLGVSVTALKEANGMNDGLIRIGQELKVPGASASQVAKAAPKGDKPVLDKTTTASTPVKADIPETVKAYVPPKKAITEAMDEEPASAPEDTGIGRMRWPVRGRVISNYGTGGGKANDGIDIAVPEGTAVKAAENGVVIYAGDGLKDFGNTVLVRHEDGLVTVYGHASELKVARGEKVKRGQEIAKSGMSGSADSPKLHFEVRKDSTPVDPSGFLE